MPTAPDTTADYSPTKNACKLCAPLGASLVFMGIENAVPLLHGSQGCATYIRRYLISHFKEPVDIASSNFTEETAIFGGGANLKRAVENLTRQYRPALIGIATTCLSETIGDDVPMMLKSIREERVSGPDHVPQLVHVSTPSYRGSHMDGFHEAVRALVDKLVKKPAHSPPAPHSVNLFPGMLSCEDLRHLKEIFADFDLSVTMLPDYSERLDGALWSEYRPIQPGGTTLEAISEMGNAAASIEFGETLKHRESAGKWMESRFGVSCRNLGIPIGVNATDAFFEVLSSVSGISTPDVHVKSRERLIDAYVDGHKYLSGLRAVVYGEEDLVIAMAGFLTEVGILPVLCATGAKSGLFRSSLLQAVPSLASSAVEILESTDFMDLEQVANTLGPDFIIGHSKGYPMARGLQLPLIRVGFPVHDRIGGSRLLHVGYRGAQQLFDRIVNTLIGHRQDASEIGYTYI
jgi:nitrogenase molybdenum-iron protein NifN